MADELGLTIDEAEFEQAQADSKEASKAQKKANKETVKLDVHDIAALEKNPDVPKTDDSAKFCTYIIFIQRLTRLSTGSFGNYTVQGCRRVSQQVIPAINSGHLEGRFVRSSPRQDSILRGVWRSRA